MMPVLWLQHEINNSYIISTKNEKSINIKYPSEEQFRETKNFEFYLFGILLLVRTLLPRKNDWCLKSSLDLLINSIPDGKKIVLRTFSGDDEEKLKLICRNEYFPTSILIV